MDGMGGEAKDDSRKRPGRNLPASPKSGSISDDSSGTGVSAGRRLARFRHKGLGRPFLSLLGMQIKVEYGGRGMAEKLGLGGRREKHAYVYLGLIALALIPFMQQVFKIANAISLASVSMGQPGVPVVLAVLGGQMMVLFMGISHLMSSLYYSNDLETLESLPLGPWTIMSSKVLVVYLGELLFSAFIVGPVLVTLGPKLGIPEFWLYAPVVYFLVPAVPVAVSLLAVVLLMRFTGRSRRKDLFRVVFGLLFFVLLLGFQYVNMNMTRYGPDFIMRALIERNSLVQVMAGYYPVLKWAAWALAGDTVVFRLNGLLLFAGTSVGAVIAAITLGQVWFLGGLGREVTSVKRGASREKGARRIPLFGKARSPVTAVALKEMKVLVRNPTFFLTALMNLLIVPILFFFGVVAGGKSSLAYFTEMLRSSANPDIFILVAAGIHGATVALNQVASTGISREGSLFSLSKQIPVSPERQVRGKLLFALGYAIIQAFVLTLVLGFGVHLAAPYLLLMLVLAILISWPISVIGLLNDVYNPRLNWTEPQQAMKGNFMTMVAGLFGLLYLVLVGVFVRALYLLGLSSLWLYLLPCLLVLGTSVLLESFLEGAARERYREIEV